MSIENGGPSAEEMGVSSETKKQKLEVTGSVTKDEIMSNYRAGKLTPLQTNQGEIQVYAESVSGDGPLAIKGVISGSVSGEAEINFDPTTGKGSVIVSESESSNPFAG
jgi:hypothetical protein